MRGHSKETNKRFAEENFDEAAYKALLFKRKTHGLNTLQKHIIEVLKRMCRVTLRSISRSSTPSFTLKGEELMPILVDQLFQGYAGIAAPQNPKDVGSPSHLHIIFPDPTPMAILA